MLNNLSKGHYASTDIYRTHAILTKDENSNVLIISDKYVNIHS